MEQAPSKGDAAGAIASASTGLAAATLTVVTTACCVSPVVAPIIVSVLGASGAAWAAGLKPYGWWILGASVVCLAYGFRTVYRPRQECAVGAPNPNRALQRVARSALWVGAAFWVVSALMRLLLPT